jgi:HlyD family secretion protein
VSIKRTLWYLVIFAGVAFVAAGVARGLQQLRSAATEIPTMRVQRGALQLNVYTTGELRPVRSAMLVAPPVGGTLQIVRLTKTGARVNAGDVVIEFDPSEQQFNLEQARSELLQAEQEIIKMKADSTVQAAQDKVDLLTARFDVRRADLEVSRNDLVSAIDAKKNLLNLEEARRKLAQLEQDVQSRQVSNQAQLAVLEEKKNKARLSMQQAQQSIENMQVRAPIDGLVAIKENQDASGGFFFQGMALPEYREGDQVWPGRMVAQILEVDRMEILSKVSETDRANINPGQAVEVQVDALPGTTYRGNVKTISGMVTRRFFDSEGRRMFDATLQLDKANESIRPGVTAHIVILGEQVKDALVLPRQALFEKEGKPVVYIKKGKGLEAREAKIRYVTESQVAVEGLEEGAEVALVNPEKKPGKASSKSSGPIAPAAGGSRR